MHGLVRTLFPITRSITGDGVRNTLRIIQEYLPSLSICEVASGTQVFDWVVPREWNIRDAYVLDPDGVKIIDMADSNLHVVGYSTPIDAKVSLEELRAHLYSLPDQPDAIPYVTSYYQERWGFCVTQEQRDSITREGDYTVVIDSSLADGALTYGELLLPGRQEEEVFLSTYVCHPSMANNELSGPAVATFVARWLSERPRKFSYRIVFVPETIGSITYLSKHLSHLKAKVVAGFNLTCVGDDRTYSYLPSRTGVTLADRVGLHVLRHTHPTFVAYSWLDRGSDERQYCAPGVDLPVASVMRSKYGTYPEYHTSKDDLDLVTPSGLRGAYDVITKCIGCIECNETPKVNVICEPQLGKRGLYPTLSTKGSATEVRDMMDLISYCDGEHDLLTIAEILGRPMWDLFPIVEKLESHGLIEKTESSDEAEESQ